MTNVLKFPKKAQGRIVELIDELGELRARKSVIETRESEILEELKKHGPGIYAGSVLEANVFESCRTSLDQKKLLTKHRLMGKWIEECSKKVSFLSCKLQARSAHK